MTYTRTIAPRPLSRASRFCSVVAALSLGLGAVAAQADTLSDLTAVLRDLARQRGVANTAAITVLNAPQNDLVYAVYFMTQQSGPYSTATGAADLVKTALSAQAVGVRVVVRADKDKTAPRLLNAAVLGTGLNDDSSVKEIASSLLSVNSGAAVAQQLTVAGKQATLAQALKNTSATESAQTLGTLAGDLAEVQPRASDVTKQAFLAAIVKTAGVAVGSVPDFTTAFTTAAGVVLPVKDFAQKVAESLAVVDPTGAGAVVQGAAATLVDDTARQDYAKLLAVDAKLARAQAAVVAGVASALSPTFAKDDFTAEVVKATGAVSAARATTAVRATVASGVLRTLDQTETALADSVIDKSLTSIGTTTKALTKAETASYAGLAAAGTTGFISAQVAIKLSNNAILVQTDTVAKTAIAKAVIKALAVTSPTSAQTVATEFITAANNAANYADDDKKTAFAVDLARTVPTNGTLTGSAVTGVAETLADKAITDGSKLLILGGNTIKFAPKAALNISMGLATVLGASPDYATFAKNLTLGNNLLTKAQTQAQAAAIAAGVAVTAVNGAGNNPAAIGQSAGDIAVAVSQGNAVLQSRTLLIASAVAVAVDVERIADVGAKVGSLLKYAQSSTANKTPKYNSLGALATSLGKAVNTKPFVSWSNRVDELGELAAEMTRAAVADLANAPSNTHDTLVASTIASIGSALIKTLSAAQLINYGSLAADKADAVGYIAGAIAQTISVLGLETVNGQPVLSPALIATLLGTDPRTSVLYKTLAAAATAKYTSGILNAFNSVGNQKTGADLTARLVTSDLNKYKLQQIGFGDVVKGTGVYEIGSLIDPETPVTNVP